MSRTVEASTLGTHRDAWDDAVRRSVLPTPFLLSWWLEAGDVGGAAYVLVVDGPRLLGGVALQRDRLLGVDRYRLRHQGVLCPDHLDLVSVPGAEDEVTAAVAAWVTDGDRLLDLAGLREGSRLAAALPHGRVRPLEGAPHQPLTGPDFLSSRGSAFRRSVRRGTTALARVGTTHHRVAEPDLPAAWADLRRLHADRPGREALLAELATLEQAVATAHRHDEARLDVLDGPDGVVAVSVAFVVAGRLSLYQLARSLAPEHASAGNVLLAAVIADAAADGAREVDLLRGDEDYKARFADHRRELVAVRVGTGRGRPVAASLTAAHDVRRRLGRAARAAAGVSRRATQRGRGAA